MASKYYLLCVLRQQFMASLSVSDGNPHSDAVEYNLECWFNIFYGPFLKNNQRAFTKGVLLNVEEVYVVCKD